MEAVQEKQIKPRVVLLYRASSKKQTDSDNDIPLQRNILKPWAERQGYAFTREFVEGGISGFKVSAAKRDAIIEIKAMAERREFEVLGIYMSDRLGRIAEETPLIVSYLNARGIKVVSYTEGEINSATHSDKLMTYIRYWQAEGESLKTSARVGDAVLQNVNQGKWRGGRPPFGYRVISRGTLNYKGKPIFDVEIDPEKSEVVKTIFQLYSKENYGACGIAKHLNDKGITSEEGCMWSGSMILKMLRNKLYAGVYVLHKSLHGKKSLVESPVMEHLRIIESDEFERVQFLRRQNGAKQGFEADGYRPTRRGSLMLSGLLYCGECGRKFTSTHFNVEKQRQNGEVWYYDRKVYRCSSFKQPKTDAPKCTGQIFTAEDLEALVIYDAKDYILSIDKEKLLRSHDDEVREQEQEANEKLKKVVREIAQREKELAKLKEEVVKVVMGESGFSQGLLSEMIQTKEAELVDLRKRKEQAERVVSDLQITLAAKKAVVEELETWSERFDAQDATAKKSMLINIIEKITVQSATQIDVVYKVELDDLGDPDPIATENAEGLENNGDTAPASGFLSKEFVLSSPQARLRYSTYWKNTHNKIAKMVEQSNNIKVGFVCEDIFDAFKNNNFAEHKFNTIILQYMFSNISGNDREEKINLLFDNLIDQIIKKRKTKPFLIIFNELDHRCQTPKYYNLFLNKLNNEHIIFSSQKRHFGVHDEEEYSDSQKHVSNAIYFDIPKEFCEKFGSDIHCKGSQLIIEVS